MDRIIKFRGKRANGAGWIVGDLCRIDNKVYVFIRSGAMAFNSPDYYEAIPESVGQFTGLLDRDGKEIYEGDIVIDLLGAQHEIKIGYCQERGFTGVFAERMDGRQASINNDRDKEMCSLIVIIGNVFDNKQLIEK